MEMGSAALVAAIIFFVVFVAAAMVVFTMVKRTLKFAFRIMIVAVLLLIAVAVFVYVCLDGFDLGVGILFPVMPDKEDRDVAVNSIAPVWDGNETWLVLGGAGLFGVFPLAYATILPALYMPLILMLLALIFREEGSRVRFRSTHLAGVDGPGWLEYGQCIGTGKAGATARRACGVGFAVFCCLSGPMPQCSRGPTN